MGLYFNQPGPIWGTTYTNWTYFYSFGSIGTYLHHLGLIWIDWDQLGPIQTHLEPLVAMRTKQDCLDHSGHIKMLRTVLTQSNPSVGQSGPVLTNQNIIGPTGNHWANRNNFGLIIIKPMQLRQSFEKGN